jgi:hypothetical protein
MRTKKKHTFELRLGKRGVVGWFGRNRYALEGQELTDESSQLSYISVIFSEIQL